MSHVFACYVDLSLSTAACVPPSVRRFLFMTILWKGVTPRAKWLFLFKHSNGYKQEKKEDFSTTLSHFSLLPTWSKWFFQTELSCQVSQFFFPVRFLHTAALTWQMHIQMQLLCRIPSLLQAVKRSRWLRFCCSSAIHAAPDKTKTHRAVKYVSAIAYTCWHPSYCLNL